MQKRKIQKNKIQFHLNLMSNQNNKIKKKLNYLLIISIFKIISRKLCQFHANLKNKTDKLMISIILNEVDKKNEKYIFLNFLQKVRTKVELFCLLNFFEKGT